MGIVVLGQRTSRGRREDPMRLCALELRRAALGHRTLAPRLAVRAPALALGLPGASRSSLKPRPESVLW